ncbi:carboxypeptidase regulatory-like domain-containing protein [Microbacterium sp. NPDC058389]|uniref:carboxypeptidase regulatory-like domain-containing protein n=1 Tax=Microbacterium sp. NPDC058389 TaxID=3346475 RepID=UPI0036673CB0
MPSVSHRYLSRAIAAALASAVALASVVLIPPAAHATPVNEAPLAAADQGPVESVAGGMTGTVRDAAGAPLSGASVTAYVEAVAGHDPVQSFGTLTDENGVYRIDNLPEGSYKVQFSAGMASSTALSEWWDDAQTRESAAVVHVDADAPLEPMDATLADGGNITGIVSDDNHSPIPGASVSVYSDSRMIARVVTTSEGRFEVPQLRPGSYTLQFSASTDEGLLSEWWDNATTAETADAVTVAQGASTDGIDVVLAESDGSSLETFTAALSGRVTDGAGAPLEGVQVDIIEADGSAGDETSTDAEGRWSFDKMAAGRYVVSFTASFGDEVVTRYWDGADEFASATVIDLAGGEQLADVSAVLRSTAIVPVESSVPVVEGVARVGRTLTALPGSWTEGTEFAFQWSIDGMPVAGATSDTFPLTPQALGKSVAVTVTGSKPGFEAVSRTSSTTAGIAAGELASAAPTISGSITVGAVLTATPGAWSPGSTLTYRWLADATVISGATTSTLTLTSALYGKKISVEVTGTQAGYATFTRRSTSTTAVKPGSLTVGTPSISGTAAVGSTLTLSTGAWTSGTKLTYQWLANGAIVSGATSTKLTLSTALKDKAISVRVTGTNTGYTDAARTSAATAKVATAATPAITGAAAAGVRLTAITNTWTPDTKFTYQWNADGVPIVGATSSTFTPGTAQDGKGITVRVTGTKSGWATVVKTSKTTLRVTRWTTPKVTGTVGYGSTLTVSRGTWSTGTAFTYQWYADGAAISGATGSSVKLSTALKDKRISVKLTGTQNGFTSVAQTSSPTSRVSTAVTPTISGIRAVGARLTAVPGAWTSGTTFAYQWYANGAPISGATGASYVLSSGTESRQITVTLTGRKSGYTTLVKSSAPTTKIMRAGTTTVVGTAQVTRTLSASAGTWTGGTALTYQWYANGAAISGATGKTYTISAAQAGKTIHVKVTGRLTGYATITKSSAATATIGYPSRTSPADVWTCPSWAPIKGNANSMIYHMPWQRYYNATKPEDCFSTESAAVAAGYRAAKV